MKEWGERERVDSLRELESLCELKGKAGAQEKAQWLRALVTLAWDPVWISAPTGWLTPHRVPPHATYRGVKRKKTQQGSKRANWGAWLAGPIE